MEIDQFRGKYILRVTTQEHEGRTYERAYLRGGVGIIPVTDDGHLILIEERDWEKNKRIKLITGYVEDGETPLACAKRELQEEIGMSASDWQLYLASASEESTIAKTQTFFIARGLKRGEPRPCPGEQIIQVHTVAPEDVVEQCRLGTFGTTGTAFVLLKLALELVEQEIFDKLH